MKLQQIVLGVVLDCSGDEDRLKREFALFDDLYASFRRRIRQLAESKSNHARTRRGNP